MCGIAGFVEHDSLPSEVIERMTNALKHRGPDANAVFRDEVLPIQLGHARLAILDLSPTGLQPMHDNSKRFTIVFNGEIYNHLDLRIELAKTVSIDWRGSSDTETLLECIFYWGLEKTLNSVHGMFAFSLLDRIEKSITLARDRFGEKPLYYHKHRSGICFASELGSLMKHPKVLKTPCKEAIYKLQTLHAIPSPLSAFENVFKLLPGTWLKYSLNGEIETSRWWSVQECYEKSQNNQFTGGEQQAIDQLGEILGNAVDRQKISDVPLGAFLSGGIDSSLIVALMQKNSTSPVNTFSIGFENPDFNEAHEAKKVATALQTSHSEVYLSDKDVISISHSLGDIYSEPFADLSQIPTILVSKMAREHVTVALTGDAGDEVFGGYRRHVFANSSWKKINRIPAFARRIAVSGIERVPEDLFNKSARLLPMTKKWTRPYEVLHKVGSTLSSKNIDEFYTEAVTHGKNPLMNSPSSDADKFEKYGLQSNLIENIESKNFKDHEASWLMLKDQANYLGDDVLTKVDRASMSASLETRVPFLDQDVVKFAWSLPEDFRIRNNQGKWILRPLLYRYLQKDLVDRPKMGFSVPMHELLRGPLKEWAEDLLCESELSKTEMFDSHSVREHWTEHKAGSQNRVNSLWPVLMYQAWHMSWMR